MRTTTQFWVFLLAATAVVGIALGNGEPRITVLPAAPAPFAPRPSPEHSVVQGPGIADIPANLPSDLKDAIEGTLSSSAVNRGKAAKVLGELGERASPAVPFLIKLLSDDAKVGSIHLPANKEIPFRPGDVVPSQDVPVTVGDNAQEALERIGKPSVERCAAALKASSDTVRRYLIEVLGEIKDSRAIEPIGALLDDPNPWLRNQAVRAFLLWDDPRIIPHLIRALRDENYRVRQSAVWVMGTVHDPRLVQPLIDALKDKDESVRRGAVKALEEQRNPRGKKIP